MYDSDIQNMNTIPKLCVKNVENVLNVLKRFKTP